MRKLWVPLSLLLLLLIVCDWQHRNSFNQPMTYSIIQHGASYNLKGTLKSEAEIKGLKLKFLDLKKSLNTTEAEKNSLLESRGSISVVEALLPLFVSQYHEGKIVYKNGTLILSGKVEANEIRQQIQEILNRGDIPTKNNTTIQKSQPISFTIRQQKRRSYRLEGFFASTLQKERLTALFQQAKSTLDVSLGDIDPALTDREKILDKLESFIPFFTKKIRGGTLRYEDGVLHVGGKVLWKKRIEEIEKILATLQIESKNSVILNIKAIKGSRAKKKAKKLVKALQKQRAKKEAIKKAEKEVSEDIVAMMNPQNEQPKKSITDSKKVRKNLNTLFETETIEFNMAQTTMTPLGLGTVSKIAVILKAYPDVKIEIAGHTDSDGDDAFNMLLSQGRVNNVKRALMQEGIDKGRIKAVGYGETKPLVPNSTEKNKQKNRRVEIIVVGE
jgi:outer membrane protein OmpA-like peptidoglycan-associated protein